MTIPRMSTWFSFEIDISDSATTSDELDLKGCYDYMLLDVPTITAATLTIQGARATGGTFRDLYDTDKDGSNAKLISDSGTGALMWCVPIHGIRFIKVVSSASQAADRTFYARGIRRYMESSSTT